MSEAEVINNSAEPITKQRLIEDFRRMGLHEGMTVIVHASMSRIGWICGGEAAVVLALMDVVGAEGTIVMPAHSSNLSDPAEWANPPVPESWWEEIRNTMPAFDPKVTPTWGMGRIAELFRTMPDVLRSMHPQHSFAAWGAHARHVTENQSLDFGMGEHSPLARIYELGGHVLLLGVDYDSNTSFHLAEYRSGPIRERLNGAPVLENGERKWRVLKEIDFRTDAFEEIGRQFEQSGAAVVVHGHIGSAPATLFKQRACVDLAKLWLERHPL